MTGAAAGLASVLAAPAAHAAPEASPAQQSDTFDAQLTIIQQDEAPVTIEGNCGDVFTPEINGAKAHWELTCGGGNITMAGWVDDTWSDGRCAYVRGEFQDGAVEIQKDCPADGPREEFKWTHPGNRAYGFLYVA
jgi:hypothetical protein